MHNTEYSPKQVIRYLLWTFVIAYIIQFLAAPLYKSNRQAGQLVLAAMMFVPALGVILSGAKLNGMGWKPQIKKNIRPILAAWFLPVILTVIGGALYFLFFPQHIDFSGSYVSALAGMDILEQLQAQGLAYPVYVLISAIAGITYAPLINMVAALGEETGWRGFLYPQLEAKFGRRKGWILGGLIWGAWHWPLIWLIGYEYGEAAGNFAGYAGAPVTGMLAFCVCAAAIGVLHAWLYEKSGTIWVPSLLHGAFNAAASLPLMLCLADTGTYRLLGPAPNGLLSGLPFLIIAAWILFRRSTDTKEQ